ncbi:hypothetical protein [Cellulomonas sp.]
MSARQHRGRSSMRHATAGRLVAGLTLVLVALTTGCSADRTLNGDGHPPTVTAAPSGKVHAPTPAGPASAGVDPSPGSSAAAGGTGSGATASTGGGSTGPGSAATGTGDPGTASEVLPPTGSAPGALVIPKVDVPRLTGPLPATASARGTLVAGFPVGIVPVPAGATIVSSSVAVEGRRLQVGLDASTAASPADVVAGYVHTLTAEGFITTDSPAGAGATATAFVSGNDGLVLTVRDRLGGGTELSIAGTLTAQT